MFWRVPRRSPPVLEINRGNLFGAHIDAYWVPGVPYTSIGTPLDDYNKLGRVGTAANTSTTNRYIAGSQKAIGGGDFSFLFVGEIPADDSPLCYFVDPTAANFPSGYLWWGESSIFTQEWVFGGHWGGGFQDIRFTFTGRPTGICAVAASFINGVGGYLSVNGRSGFSANVISRGTASGHVFTLGSDSGSIGGATRWNLAASFNRAWPPEILNTLTKDLASPWQIFAPTRRPISFQGAGVSNDIAAAGSLSITGAADLDATGSLIAAGSLAITGVADLDARGSLIAAGSLSITGAADLDARGVLVAAGSLAITGVADLDATGSLIAAGSLAISGTADLSGVGSEDISAVGSVSITGAAALTALGQMSAAGSIVISGVAQLGTGVEPVVVESQKPAGSRKRRRRYVVEIDGQDFEVESPEHAQALLERAKALATETIEQAAVTPSRVLPGITRPRVRTRDPELAPIVRQAQAELTQIYDDAARDFEIRMLMARAAEEEEALIRLLM